VFQFLGEIPITENPIKNSFHRDFTGTQPKRQRHRGSYLKNELKQRVAAFDENRQASRHRFFETAHAILIRLLLMQELVTWAQSKPFDDKSPTPLAVIAVFIVVFLENPPASKMVTDG